MPGGQYFLSPDGHRVVTLEQALAESATAEQERRVTDWQLRIPYRSREDPLTSVRQLVLDEIVGKDAVQWAERHERKQSVLQAVVTMFALAVDEELIDKNSFRGLMRKPKGRADEAPPTDAEFDELLAACSVLGDHGPRMRSLLSFAASSGMRPGELMALDWPRHQPPGATGHGVEAAVPGQHGPPEVEQGPRHRAHAARP
jgi:integrase